MSIDGSQRCYVKLNTLSPKRFAFGLYRLCI